MNAQNASRTAMVASLMRAIHTRSDPHPIHRDNWGERLVPKSAWSAFYQLARSRNPSLPEIADDSILQAVVGNGLRSSPAYANIIIRSRYAEDALHQAVSRGIRQYVLIGAGFDSYALRTPCSDRIVVIEIDHPATQSLKRQCLVQSQIDLPDSIHLVPADLSTEDLSSVLRTSLPRPAEPAFFSWLGVTMYLTKDANLKTLRAISSTAAPGSELVFEYVDQSFFDSNTTLTESEHALRQAVATMGEPWVCGFNPSKLQSELALAGFSLLEDLPDVDLIQRYDPQGLNNLSARGLGRLALARLGGPSDASYLPSASSMSGKKCTG
jgi:methyltransferase (TIGR00027 family)